MRTEYGLQDSNTSAQVSLPHLTEPQLVSEVFCRQTEDLKPKVLKKTDLLHDSEAWENQQKLQNIYHRVLILDLEYALDKKVEQDLWNIGFKNHITELQEKVRDKKVNIESSVL